MHENRIDFTQKQALGLVCELIYGLVLPLLLVILLASGCSDDTYGSPNNSGGGNPGANEVWLQGFAFNPATITVSAGTTITWTNKDNVIHTVTSGAPGSPNGLFNSGNLGQNVTFTFTFASAGTYPYYCIPHASTMQGNVIAQ